MKTAVFLACVSSLAHTQSARAQSITAEATTTAGYSTDDVFAGAAQLRAFGDVKGGIRFFAEAAWARSSNDDSDAFGAAYPYRNRVQVIEAYAERMFRPGGALLSVRAGRFRPPFGISSASDYAYSGFLRAPLIRYEEHAALSNYALEHGADFIVGVPWLTVEAAFGAPADVGVQARRSDFDAVVRIQGYRGPFIIGVSHIRTSPPRSLLLARGRTDFTGIDVRWTYGGVQLRGEWITGQPFDGATTSGWYADASVHRSGMGPFTAVARVERLDHEGADEESDDHPRREAVGVRVRLPSALALIVNVVHQTGAGAEYRSAALDIGLTWSIRSK